MGLKHGVTIPLSNLNFFWDAANIVSDKRTAIQGSTSRDLIDLSGTLRDQFYATGSNIVWNSGNLGYRTTGGSSIYMQLMNITNTQNFSFCTWVQGATGVSGNAFGSNNLEFQVPNTTVVSGVGVSVIFKYGGTNTVFKTPSASDILGWTFWSGTKNLTTGVMSLYRNGELYVTRSSMTEGNDLTSQGLRIFTNYGGGNLLFNPISMLVFYTKELSAAEVEQFFDATRGRYGI